MARLLFLSHRIPYPPDKGEKIRAWHIFRHLARTHDIHLGCLIDDPADWAHVPTLRNACADLGCFGIGRRRQRGLSALRARPGRSLSEGYFQHPPLRSWVTRTLQETKIDRAFVFCSAMAPYLIADTRLPRILDMVDVDSDKFAAYAAQAGWPACLLWRREARTLLSLERRAALAFSRSLFVSEAERRRFTTLAPETRARTDTLDNGVDLDRFDPALTFPRPFAAGGPALVFTGTMDYWPNADAVIWFADRVLPLVRRNWPDAILHVVGANPSAAVRALATRTDIRVTGRVPDTRPYIAHADLVVAPLRIARGVQNKVLEAMAMGRPVLATEAAAEGIRARPGTDLLVVDDAAAMADGIDIVLTGGHPGLGASARRAMERSYDWSRTLARLDAMWPLARDPMAEHAGGNLQ